MANNKTIKFGPVARFRLLEGDLEILRAAAQRHGQTLSAYLRDAVIARALDDVGATTRAEAAKMLARGEISASEL
jgi:hypothetical protein